MRPFLHDKDPGAITAYQAATILCKGTRTLQGDQSGFFANAFKTKRLKNDRSRLVRTACDNRALMTKLDSLVVPNLSTATQKRKPNKEIAEHRKSQSNSLR